jgi:4a-hydroxytetrahydrobiopterin dehydratase
MTERLTVLSFDEIERHLKSHPLWFLNDGKLHRTFEAKTFEEALKFVTAIGHIADHHQHHPDIHLTGYKHVDISLSTPRLFGITNLDIEMVRLFDEIPVEYSLKWKKTHEGQIKTQVHINCSLTFIRLSDFEKCGERRGKTSFLETI